MSGPTIEWENIETAHSLKDQNLPDRIYKFRGINDLSLNNLADNKLWVCSPSTYNDPYECHCKHDIVFLYNQALKWDFEGAVNGLKLGRFFDEANILKIRQTEEPLKEIFNLLGPAAETEGAGEFAQILKIAERTGQPMIDRMNRRRQECIKVCSFSERVDSLLMWGHYADSHSGFCIEYCLSDLAPSHELRRNLYPVYYSRELFDATQYLAKMITDNQYNYHYGIIASSQKSEDWSYEKEWRLIFPRAEPHPNYELPVPSPSGIYLGACISEANEIKLSKIANEMKIPLKRMAMSRKEYLLEVVGE